MNVKKVDIFLKPKAVHQLRSTRAPNFSVVNSSKNAYSLPFTCRQTPNDNNIALSQQSSVSSGSQSSYLYDDMDESVVFQEIMQPFIDECKNDSIADSSNADKLFTKLVPSEARKSGSHSTSEILINLNNSVTNDANNLSLGDLELRVPNDQYEEILCGADVDANIPTDMLEPLGSPLSSIRPNTTINGSGDKKTGKVPKNARNTTTSSTTNWPTDNDPATCIIAVTEGRGLASGEVGIAAMDPHRPHLLLCQISDSQQFHNSLAKMNALNFTEAIVPNTFVNGPAPRKLYLDIMERFPAVTVSEVLRKHFSEAVGLKTIQQYCNKDSESVMLIIKDKFYALAAAAALIKYIEFTQNVLIAPRSLRIEFQGKDGTTIIDIDTANRLELVLGIVTREVSHSLLGVLKHCRTKGGLRLLRTNLLQPFTDAERINSRLDCVSELIENPILFNGLEVVISQMKFAENLLRLCMHPPQQTGLKAAQYQLKYTILLKNTLELVPALSTALQEASSEFFIKVRENLGDARLTGVLDRVLMTVVDGSPGGKPGQFSQLNACFMIRTGINGLLDVAKKTYCELSQEIADLVTALREKYNLPLRLGYTQTKGYHIQLNSLDKTKDGELPAELILVQKSRTSLTCYTKELVALDQRCLQVLHEIQYMTNVLIFELLCDIREDISCLYPLCESLAELDVCIALAHAGSGQDYVRPSFSSQLQLVDARHPILDVITKDRIVSNSVCADVENNFIILTGPNQSGKSIFIRQIALLQVMAQVGCFVPAKEATFRIADRIFSRIGFDDSIETNSSTLMVEMQDMQFITKNLTGNSIVIVDELCRGTSVDEGTALAFAICETLIDTSAFVFFTTHFFFLTKLQHMYFNVRNYYFETHLAEDEMPALRFSHRMLEGVTPADQYGIRLAELMAFPSSIIEKAKVIADTLSKEIKPQPEVCGWASRYALARDFRVALSHVDQSWDQILPIIVHFKDLYNKLPEEDEQLRINLENERESLQSQNTHIDELMLLSQKSHEENINVTAIELNLNDCVQPLENADNLEYANEKSDNLSIIGESSNVDLNIGPNDVQEEGQNSITNVSQNEPQTEKESAEKLPEDGIENINDSNENSERTREAAQLLLNLASTSSAKIPMGEVKSKPPKPIKRLRKGLETPSKKVKVPSLDSVIKEMSAGLPSVTDKSAYYQWKYSRNKSALKTVAVASRNGLIAGNTRPVIQAPLRIVKSDTCIAIGSSTKFESKEGDTLQHLDVPYGQANFTFWE